MTDVRVEREATTAPRPPGPEGGAHGRRRLLIAAIATSVVVVAAFVGIFVWAGDGEDVATEGPSTTEVTTAPTTAPPATAAPTTDPADPADPTTTVTPPPVDTSTAVFPFASSSVGYDDPVEVALAFARDYIGMTAPTAGEFMQGDARSGEVEVRAVAEGPVTTVFVRQLGSDGSWWVLGSAAPSVVIDRPDAGGLVSSPVTVTGRAQGFEGRMTLQVRQDGSTAWLGETIGTAGATGLEPFEEDVTFPTPAAQYGAIVAYGASGLGEMVEATVVRVRFS